MNSAEFLALQATRTTLQSLAETWALVWRKVEDGRPAEAVPLIEEAIKVADGLGDDFTLTDNPVCLACKGYAEMASPIEADRRVRCQDVPSVCKGNKYGRMHPVQLRDFVLALCPPAPEVPPIHDSVGGESTPETTGESGEPKPTPVE